MAMQSLCRSLFYSPAFDCQNEILSIWTKAISDNEIVDIVWIRFSVALPFFANQIQCKTIAGWAKRKVWCVFIFTETSSSLWISCWQMIPVDIQCKKLLNERTYKPYTHTVYRTGACCIILSRCESVYMTAYLTCRCTLYSVHHHHISHVWFGKMLNGLDALHENITISARHSFPSVGWLAMLSQNMYNATWSNFDVDLHRIFFILTQNFSNRFVVYLCKKRCALFHPPIVFLCCSSVAVSSSSL